MCAAFLLEQRCQGVPVPSSPEPHSCPTVPQPSLEKQAGMPHLKSIQALSPGQVEALYAVFVGFSPFSACKSGKQIFSVWRICGTSSPRDVGT